MRYALWIALLGLTPETARGRCKEFAEDMRSEFPELRLVRGHYHDEHWGKQEHWWLDLENRVIDPTAVQFPSAGDGVYEELPEGVEESTGRCPNCGEQVYGGITFCDMDCETEYRDYLLS